MFNPIRILKTFTEWLITLLVMVTSKLYTVWSLLLHCAS